MPQERVTFNKQFDNGADALISFSVFNPVVQTILQVGDSDVSGITRHGRKTSNKCARGSYGLSR